MNNQRPPPEQTAAPASLVVSDAADAAEAHRLALSALVDGELDAAEAAHVCAGWSADSQTRRTWHAYQWIGDALRSDELASPPARDAVWMDALRVRLAAEPVVLAPQPLPATSRARRGAWRVPVALAAGVVAVAGVVSVLQPSLVGVSSDLSLAALPGGAAQPVLVQVGAAAPSRDQMLRDARVDEYLRAHRDAFAGSPVALPGGALRSVEFQPPPR